MIEMEAAKSMGIRKTARKEEEKNTSKEKKNSKRRKSSQSSVIKRRRKSSERSILEDEEDIALVRSYKIPKKKLENSQKFKKEDRPPTLQDDDLVNAMDINTVALAVMKWKEIQVQERANAIKEKKVDGKSRMKKNTPVKEVLVKEGKDDATKTFHPQRFLLRYPVVAPYKYWELYPTHWEEVYYSTYLEHVGLENTLGQKQVGLLHDRRSDLKIHYFSQLNANVGKDKLATNLTFQQDGSAEVKNKEDWAEVVTMNELMMALDNLVAAWSVFWPGDHSVVTLRRVGTRQKEFVSVNDGKTRRKLLEAFINKILEINSRRAAQGETPMSFKEVYDQSKEYLESPGEFVRMTTGGGGSFTRDKKDAKKEIRKPWISDTGDSRKRSIISFWELVKKIKIDGQDICLDFNKVEGCKDKRCARIHRCCYMERGDTSKVCGEKHSKIQHLEKRDGKP